MNATSILLTGATGSLGGQICAELLRNTSATVHCLVRAADRDDAAARVAGRMQLLDQSPSGPQRLTAYPADLQLPDFGLSANDYDALAESITTIVHCAASVDLGADYDRLAATNVAATRNLIEFAHRRTELTGRPPAFHSVSTLGVLLDARRADLPEVDEHTTVTESTSGPLGYPRSKAVAEMALWEANRGGLPVTVYRPAVVTGNSVTGRTSSSDLLTPLLWAAVAVGAIPDCAAATVPAERVDVVARAVVTLVRASRSAGRAFHLVHPRPLPLNELFDALPRAGHRLSRVPVEDWWRRVEKDADHPAVQPLAAMSAIAHYLVPAEGDRTAPDILSDETWGTLGELGMPPLPLDGAFLDRLVSHLRPPGGIVAPRRIAVGGVRPGLRVDGQLTPLRFGHTGEFPDAAAGASACEAAGYGMFWAQEQTHDPTPALAVAAHAAPGIAIGTNVLVALARSPMTVAHAAHDLQALSRGRFVLGLGPQFAANLKYRFSMPSDRRLARLREFVAALHAIWAYWNDGRPLRFRGKFYTHTLVSPFFTPPPSPWGPPKIVLAATGPRAAELAGEIADGLAAPPYANVDHLTRVLLPAAERGLERSGRTREEFMVTINPLLTVEPEDVEHSRLLLALWGGTRAYRSLFEPYDLGPLADELAELSLSADPDRWRRMADRIDDRTLDLFTVRAEAGQLGATLRATFGGHADRVVLPAPLGPYTPEALGLAAADPDLEKR